MSSRAPLRALGGMRKCSDRKCIELYANMSPKKKTKSLVPCLVFYYEKYMAIVVMPSPASHLIKVKKQPSSNNLSLSFSSSSSSSFSFLSHHFLLLFILLFPSPPLQLPSPPLPPSHSPPPLFPPLLFTFYLLLFLHFILHLSFSSLSSCFLNPISHFPYLTFVVRVFLTTLCKIINISHFLLQQSSGDSSLSKCILFNLLSTFPHQNANLSKVCSHLVPFSYFP